MKADRRIEVTLHITQGDALLCLAVLVAINSIVLLWLAVTTKRFRMRVHGPRLDLTNPYVRRDIAEGGPLSGTGVVPSGSNVLPMSSRQGRRKKPTLSKPTVVEDKEPEPVS